MNDERDERKQLADDLKQYLANPNPAPAAPVNPGANAPLAEREDYLALVRDAEVHAILAKDSGEVTRAERDRVNREILDCLKKGW